MSQAPFIAGLYSSFEFCCVDHSTEPVLLTVRNVCTCKAAIIIEPYKLDKGIVGCFHLSA